MGLREQQQQVARRAITDAALRLFVQSGYAHTSIDDIATGAGVARRTVYNYFDSKGEILVAGLDDRTVADRERSQSGDHARFAATEDPYQALALFGELTGRILERTLPLYRVATEAASYDGDVAKRLETQEQGRFHAQAFAVRVLSDKGQLRTDVDFDHLHRGFWLLAGPRPALVALDAGWTLQEYVAFLVDALQRFLLPC